MGRVEGGVVIGPGPDDGGLGGGWEQPEMRDGEMKRRDGPYSGDTPTAFVDGFQYISLLI